MSSKSNPSEDRILQTPPLIFSIFFVMVVVYSLIKRLLCGVDRTSSPGNLERSNPDHHHHSLQFQEHGLELCVMPSLPMSQFKKEGEGEEEKPRNTECAICLGEFEEEEWVKKLPNCNHIFHVSCIDKWFLSHSNCPLCRSSVHHELTLNTESPIILETLSREHYAQETASHFQAIRSDILCNVAPRQQTSSSN